jgi:branched-chain amino acid aminotransferase
MTNLCNVNGTITSEQEARIPALDRGFLFGDSVYEVMRTRGGIPFAWPEHLERLRASADGIALAIEKSDADVMRMVKRTLEAAGNPESYVRIIVSRGTATAPNIDLSYAPGPETYVVYVRELPPPPPSGAKLAVIPRRRTDRRAFDPGIKSGNYLNNLLGLAEAKERGASDCLFLNIEGQVTEASTSNFYLVKDGRIRTPPLGAGLLAGITRRLLFEHVARGFDLAEAQLTQVDLAGADEMFLSSTMRDVLPVTHVDGKPVRDGKPGPVTLKVRAALLEACERHVREIDAPRYAAL